MAEHTVIGELGAGVNLDDEGRRQLADARRIASEDEITGERHSQVFGQTFWSPARAARPACTERSRSLSRPPSTSRSRAVGAGERCASSSPPSMDGPVGTAAKPPPISTTCSRSPTVGTIR
jgi:hypothetical protein